MKPIKEMVQKILSVSWSWDRPEMNHRLSEIGAIPVENSDSSAEERKFTDRDGSEITAVFTCKFRGPLVSFLIETGNVENLDEAAYDQILCEFDDKFEAIAAEIGSLIGEPDYTGPASGSEVTKGQFGDTLACWLREDGRLMLQMGQRDTELPLEITIVMAAPQKK